jgi:DNA-binding response OmpR family regulator/HD-like signal output (HDOD) protein
MKILLLEDEPAIGKMLLTFLEKWKMDTVFVQTPQEAIEALNDGEFELLITDLVMPEMTGIELIRKLRRTSRYQDLPVLMISGKADKQDVIEATETGISDFMAKPFQPDEFKKRILAIFKERKRLDRERQILQVWNDRTPTVQEIYSPHIVFGEPIDKVEELQINANRKLVTYLNHAREIIAELNEAHPSLKLGYIIEDNTLDIILPLVRHAAKKWINLIMMSTRCRGKPILLVRLFTINRREDLPVFLIYDRRDDILPDERKALKKLGVRMLKRANLGRERLRRLFDNHLIKRLRLRALTPVDPSSEGRGLRSRIITDIEAMTTLPALPRVYEHILTLSRDPESDLKNWIKFIKVDPMTSAVIIGHANSLSYGFKGRITDVDRAVILLGKDTVSGLVASEAMRQAFSAVQEQGFVLEDFWLHNLAVGFAAYILSFPLEPGPSGSTKERNIAGLELGDEVVGVLKQINLPRRLKLDYTRENPFVGGIMHDIGKGVMVQSYPGLFPLFIAALKRENWNAPMAAVEEEIAGGLTHPVVGEILAQKWGLEEEVRQVILRHHHPDVDKPFAFLIGAADILGQALYPFPRSAHYPVAQALEEGRLEQVSHFLPAEFCSNPLLSLSEFTTLAQAIAPRVKYLTEKMRLSIH